MVVIHRHPRSADVVGRVPVRDHPAGLDTRPVREPGDAKLGERRPIADGERVVRVGQRTRPRRSVRLGVGPAGAPSAFPTVVFGPSADRV